jgi:NAD(P)-dependent dehydrogenase (short-subunit alcohol dehydrogenase family)
MHATGRIGEPKDISNAIQFLINPENNWITGQTLSIDGGMSTTK